MLAVAVLLRNHGAACRRKNSALGDFVAVNLIPLLLSLPLPIAPAFSLPHKPSLSSTRAPPNSLIHHQGPK